MAPKMSPPGSSIVAVKSIPACVQGRVRRLPCLIVGISTANPGHIIVHIRVVGEPCAVGKQRTGPGGNCQKLQSDIFGLGASLGNVENRVRLEFWIAFDRAVEIYLKLSDGSPALIRSATLLSFVSDGEIIGFI